MAVRCTPAILLILGIVSILAVPAPPARISITALNLPEKFSTPFRGFLPEQVIAFLEGMSTEERAMYNEIVANYDHYESDEKAYDALKAKNLKLYEKAVELRRLMKNKYDSMTPAAREFVDKGIEKITALKREPTPAEVREVAREMIEHYKALPEEAKESLKKHFPSITSVIQSEKFHKLAHVPSSKEQAAVPAA